jgi:DNA-binding transcriptional regulator YiaG
MSADDVKRIRAKTGLSATNFALCYGFDQATVRSWERGASKPHAHCAVLLTLIDRIPDICNRVATEMRR